MPRTKKFKNMNYSDSPLIWFSYCFLQWHQFALLFLLVLGLTILLKKVTLFFILYLFISTWGAFQMLNLFMVIVLQAPLIKAIDINYRNESLTISYKYPFGKLQVKSLEHNSFTFRIWRNKYESLTTIKTEDFKLTVRDGQFGLDILDLWKLNAELGKIGEKYSKFFD